MTRSRTVRPPLAWWYPAAVHRKECQQSSWAPPQPRLRVRRHSLRRADRTEHGVGNDIPQPLDGRTQYFLSFGKSARPGLERGAERHPRACGRAALQRAQVGTGTPDNLVRCQFGKRDDLDVVAGDDERVAAPSTHVDDDYRAADRRLQQRLERRRPEEIFEVLDLADLVHQFIPFASERDPPVDLA